MLPPIPPIDEHDRRPAIKDLIKTKRLKIDKIYEGIKDDPLFSPTKHDDLWILRFALSHNKTKAAIEAARECLFYRNKYKLDKQDIRNRPPHKDENGATAAYIGLCDDLPVVHAIPDPQRGVVMFVYYKNINQHRLLKELPNDDIQSVFIQMNEWAFQNLDYVTRTTGRLTKTVRICDLDGFSMASFSLEHNRREAGAIAALENVYPQLLDTIVLCNAPTWFRIPWNILKPLIPKRVTSKVNFLNPQEKGQKQIFKHISESNLPIALGGTNKLNPAKW